MRSAAKPGADSFTHRAVRLGSIGVGGVASLGLLVWLADLPFLRTPGQKAGLFSLEIGVALAVLVTIVLLVALIALTARGLDTADRGRRGAEAALEASLAHVKCLVDSNVVGVVTGSADGWILEANDAYLEMSGYTRAELPLRWDTTRPDELKEKDGATLATLATTGTVPTSENVVVRKDGRRVPVLAGLVALPEGEGRFVAFVLDQSEKKRAEAEVDRMKTFLDSIVENLPDMVFVKEAHDLRFVRVNRAAEEILACRREDLLGKNDYDWFPTEQADFFTSRDREVLASGQLLDIPEETITTMKGEKRLLHTKKVPIVDERGKPLYLLGISQDVTEKRHAEEKIRALHEAAARHAEKLEVANKELEAFSYSVSHDLRGPLRHVDGFADLLRRRAESTLDEKSRQYLDQISESARLMGSLIDDLLMFSRMGRAEMQRTTISLDVLVAQVRHSLAPEMAGRTIDWHVAPLPRIQGDPAMLRLVLTNLLSNAIKYTRTRPTARIDVGANESDGEVTVFVRDNGVGFDMEYAHKLFGMFQRLHRQEEFEGTGIGLANVRRIVHRHGGLTWAEGRLDEGATFYFSMPKQEAEAMETREAA
jgi:PAS domain S-box-containing protein